MIMTNGYPRGTSFDIKTFLSGKMGVEIKIPQKQAIIKNKTPRKTGKVAV